MKLTVSDYIVKRLCLEGIGHVFLLPGGGCMYLVDSIARQNQLVPITLLHEQSVGIAAEAYAQLCNGIGVALVTTGPGATNIITPCAAAWTDSTPMLIISGQVKSEDSSEKFGVRQLGFQEVPITEIVGPITKRAIKLKSAHEIVEVLEDLLLECRNGRPGPVWLDIPLDIQNSSFDLETFPQPKSKSREILANEEVLVIAQKIVNELIKAKRPCLLIGNGVRLSGRIEEMRETCHLLNIPTLLTWKMIDFLDDLDPINAGRPGSIPQPWSNLIQQECDLLISFGARIDTGQSAYNLNQFAIKARKIVIDVDALEFRKFPTEGYTFLNTDLKLLIPKLLSEINNQLSKLPNWHNWGMQVSEIRKKFKSPFNFETSNQGQVSLYKFVDCLAELLPSNALLIPGSSGACSEVVMQSFRVKIGQRIFNSEGLGPMGFATPAVIGAFLASKGQKVISIDGDGGFLMNLQELASVQKYVDHVIYFVLNNNGYGSIKATQDRLFEGRRLGTDPLTGLALVDLQRIASTFDFRYRRLDSNTSLQDSIVECLRCTDSVLVEVMVDQNHRTLPRVKSTRDIYGKPIPSDMSIMDF